MREKHRGNVGFISYPHGGYSNPLQFPVTIQKLLLCCIMKVTQHCNQRRKVFLKKYDESELTLQSMKKSVLEKVIWKWINIATNEAKCFWKVEHIFNRVEGIWLSMPLSFSMYVEAFIHYKRFWGAERDNLFLLVTKITPQKIHCSRHHFTFTLHSLVGYNISCIRCNSL